MKIIRRMHISLLTIIILGLVCTSFARKRKNNPLELINSTKYALICSEYRITKNQLRSDVVSVFEDETLIRDGSRIHFVNPYCSYWRNDTCYITSFRTGLKGVHTNLTYDARKTSAGWMPLQSPSCDITILFDFVVEKRMLDSLMLSKFILPKYDKDFPKPHPYKNVVHHRINDSVSAFVLTQSYGTLSSIDSITYKIKPLKGKLNFNIYDVLRSDSIASRIVYRD